MIDRDEYYILANADCLAVAQALGMIIDEGSQTTPEAVHIKHSGGLYIFPFRNNWYRHSDGKQGFPVDLVMDTLACTKDDALNFIRKNVTLSYSCSPLQQSKQPFILPEKFFPEHVRWYLTTIRGIDIEITDYLISEGSIAEDKIHHNCMFVGFDKNKNPRSCALRGTSSKQFRGEVSGGNKSYSFAIQGNSKKLRVFESPIDLMSNATFAKLLGINWLADHRLSANGCGHAAIFRYLKDYPQINEVTLSLDNDNAGRTATKVLKSKIQNNFGARIVAINQCFPYYKDWNEQLQQFRKAEKQNISANEFFEIIKEISFKNKITNIKGFNNG